jgi:Ni/Fe-hydrogenase 1 B-type cytochrome subunit
VTAPAQSQRPPAQSQQPPAATPDAEESARIELVRVRVWDLPVRLVHWLIVFSILVLSVTGFLIGDPVFRFAGTSYWVTWDKAIHMVTAYIFIALILARVIWMFRSPNRWCRWTEWIPTTKARWSLLVPSLRYYLFLDREGPPVVGHNPLAGMAYTVLYLMFGIEILTGVTLWGVQGEGWAASLTGWLIPLVSLQTIRFIHHMIMWLIVAFLVHHVYSAMLLDRVEKSGVNSSIFSGFKFLPKDRL